MKVMKNRGIDAFDNCFVAIDEFHHVSASDNNRLGVILRSLINRDQCHIHGDDRQLFPRRQ